MRSTGVRARPRFSAWGFGVGVLIGLMVVVPKILFQFGIEIGSEGETWAMIPGVFAAFFMVAGIFMHEGRYALIYMLVGVLLNGGFYALVGHAIDARLRKRGERG